MNTVVRMNTHIYTFVHILFKQTGMATITNGMATMTVDELECEVTYDISARGTLNGALVGPRSFHGTVTSGPCPLPMPTPSVETPSMSGKEKISRHTVVCQRPRKPCDAQVCNLQEPLTHRFQPLVSLQPLGQFLSNSHMLCPLYTQPFIPNLTEISPVVYEICVPENCPIFFTFFFFFFFFSPFYKSNFEPNKNTLAVDRFLSNLAHL